MDCANGVLLKADQWHDIAKIPDVEVFITFHRAKIQGDVPFLAPTCRKRRRQDDSVKIPQLLIPAIVGPDSIGIRYPSDLDKCAKAVVNALSAILPLDIKLNLFGFAHAMVLVGVLYKHGNLCWIVLNRMNLKFYIASHFVADALHLFNKHRQRLEFDPERKWNRQGINEIMTLAVSPEQRNLRNITRMNSLPKGVLRFNATARSFNESTEFLRCVGPSGSFLQKFTRKQPAPPGFTVPPEYLCHKASGWKTFKKTNFDQPCKPTCVCSHVQVLRGVTTEDSVINLISAVPSSLEKTSQQNAFALHFKNFIQFIQTNPTIGFYPEKDI